MLHIRIITPEHTIVDEQVDEITLPTVNGEITILPSHIPLLTQVRAGTITLKKGQNVTHLAVMGGFVEMGKDSLTLLADYAVHGSTIDVVKAQQAKEHAQRLLQENLTEKDFALAQAQLQKALLELHVADKIKIRK